MGFHRLQGTDMASPSLLCPGDSLRPCVDAKQPGRSSSSTSNADRSAGGPGPLSAGQALGLSPVHMCSCASVCFRDAAKALIQMQTAFKVNLGWKGLDPCASWVGVICDVNGVVVGL